MKLASGAAFVGAVCLLGAPSALAQWTPPLGIPAPSFGTTQVAPPSPNPWTSQVPGFYYVDRTHPAATDTSNTYGTPARPRRTMPNTLPAASVVEIHGAYDFAHTSPATVHCNGTAAAPIFVRGMPGSIALRPWEVSGAYCIVENLEFSWSDPGKGLFLFLAPANHVAVRGCNMHGNLNGGGAAVVSYDTTTASDVVFYGNVIHDNGNVAATFDQDVHGIVVGSRVSNVWIVDNELARNSGDGVQVNGDLTTTHHIYMGRNVTHHNKQTGLWTKEASDVIFSQNTAYGHRPSNSSPGAGMGGQYGPERVWYLFNNIYDNTIGIIMASDLDSSVKNHYYVGNLITTTAGDAALIARGGTNITMVANTLDLVAAGIQGQGGSKKWTIAQNIMSRVSGLHIELEAPPLGGSTRRNDLYSSGPATSGAPSCTGCITASPGFADPAAGDYRLAAGSAAVDTGGAAAAVYATFQSTYGISIQVDLQGVLRPFGAAWDIGAYEYSVAGIAAGDASVNEGAFGTQTALVPVQLSQAHPSLVTVSYATANGTAVAGSDYTSTSGVLSFTPGSTFRQVPVPVIGDQIDEDNETFNLVLSNPVNGVLSDATGVVTITDDDAPPQVSSGDCGVREGDAGQTTCSFGVKLSWPSSHTVTVNYATANGSATAGADYQAGSGVVTFPALETSRSVGVQVVGDTSVETDETFVLNLTNPSQATIGNGQGLGYIEDDDAPALSQDELVAGWVQEADLAAGPGPVADVDYYRVQQSARSSYEAIIDATSGDIGPGLLLERMASDNATVLQSATAVGTGSAVSLRWVNTTAASLTSQHLRVRSGQCSTSCGPDDRYRIRFYDTTYSLPRFNASTGSVTVVFLQNRLTTTVGGSLYFWDALGALLHVQPFSIAPRALYSLILTTIPALQGKSGTATIAHNAGYGALAGKATSIDPILGATFDTPLEPRPH